MATDTKDEKKDKVNPHLAEEYAKDPEGKKDEVKALREKKEKEREEAAKKAPAQPAVAPVAAPAPAVKK
jgi:hypothetical protein